MKEECAGHGVQIKINLLKMLKVPLENGATLQIIKKMRKLLSDKVVKSMNSVQCTKNV
jgi:hypothetical protein